MLPLRWLNPGLDEIEMDGLIHSWLDTFQLNLDLSLRPVAYRPGPLKLLSFIRALLLAPRALVIDDPYYLLNKGERKVLYDILTRLRYSYPMLIASTDDDFGSPFAENYIDLSSFTDNYYGS
jgi:energy-coupling factor transporter ATP-binding protein EcfA2